MNELEKQPGAERSLGEDHLRTRYDGIEHVGNQQLEALHRLDAESKTTACGVVRNGQLAALQGRFPTETSDPIQAATAFLEKHAAAFGFDIRNDVFDVPQLLNCDEGLLRDVVTVVFAHHMQRVPTYRAGVAVGVDKGGTVRFARALIPALIDAPEGRDADGAWKVAAALLGKGELPEADI